MCDCVYDRRGTQRGEVLAINWHRIELEHSKCSDETLIHLNALIILVNKTMYTCAYVHVYVLHTTTITII